MTPMVMWPNTWAHVCPFKGVDTEPFMMGISNGLFMITHVIYEACIVQIKAIPLCNG